MAENKIGIKLADGSFFPVIGLDSGEHKKLVLTTSRDFQEKVKIDFFMGEEESSPEMLVPVGEMFMEDLESETQGTPEIKLFLSIDSDGNLIARAVDDVVGEEESKSYVIPLSDEFHNAIQAESATDTLDSDFLPSLSMDPGEDMDTDFGSEEESLRNRGNIFLAAGFVLVGLFIISMLSFLFFRQFEKSPQPELRAEPAQQSLLITPDSETGSAAGA